MSKVFASMKRGLKQAIRHREGKRVAGLKLRMPKRQYRRYLVEVDRLVALDPDPRTDDGARLERLAKLVEDYEKEHFSFRQPPR